MDEVEETCFLEITQVFSSSAETNEKKLVLTLDDVNTFRSVLDQLNEFQHLLQDILVPLLKRHKVDVHIVNQVLQFPELTRSFINRDTDAGILKDDLQQFRMFHAAMRLVTKSVDERGLELSDQVQSLLSDMTSIIWRVLRKNDISPPEPPRSGRLEEELNKTTRGFLEYVGEHNKENVLTAEMTTEDDFTDNRSADLRAIYDVRNYVIVRDLSSYLLLNFQKDLGHLIR